MSHTSTLADSAAPPISLEWRVLEILPDKRYEAELRLTNLGDVPLADGWALYFNSGNRLLTESVSDGFSLVHINGDFFALRPMATPLPIGVGDDRIIRWQGAPQAINISDAPSGCYFVPDDNRPQPTTIPIDLTVGPFPTAARPKAVPPVPLPPAESLIPIVPTPSEFVSSPGDVTVSRSTLIEYDESLAAEAAYLASELGPLLGAIALATQQSNSVSTNQKGGDTIRLRTGVVNVRGEVRQEGDEAYLLIADPDDGIEIIGSDAAGVFYGLQSLQALLPVDAFRAPLSQLTIGAVRIADAPRFRYRGLLVDVARNFQSVETVKKLLDLMACYKLNRFHWHLTDDEGWRIEIHALPELTAVGARRGHTADDAELLVPSHGSGPFADATGSPGNGFYTQDDVIEVLRYAAARHITVILELDFPGHARAAINAMASRQRRFEAQGNSLAAEEFVLRDPTDASKYESAQLWHDNVVDVGLASTYRFLSTVVGELCDIYRRAGAPLASVHVGGDEVPAGAWTHSRACAAIQLEDDPRLSRRQQLELYFLHRVSDILTRHGVDTACWEDGLLNISAPSPSGRGQGEGGQNVVATASSLPTNECWDKLVLPAADADRTVRTSHRGTGTTTAYVWNDVAGAGRDDAAQRLLATGFDVVLCNATHLYFDLAHESDPAEPGQHWAGFVDTRRVFEFAPPTHTGAGAGHVLGIQGQLWGEHLRNPERLEYIAFPRLLALAERAWVGATAGLSSNVACVAALTQPRPHSLDSTSDRNEVLESSAANELAVAPERTRQQDADWHQFANRLGQHELPRLDFLFGGVRYRLPPPHTFLLDGSLHAHVEFPGLAIRYTTDGTEPTAASAIYIAPIAHNGTIKLRSFDTRGRGSRTVTVVKHL